jgi:hypothetical protein
MDDPLAASNAMAAFFRSVLGACVAASVMHQPAHAQAPILQVTPATDISAEIAKDGDPPSFRYALSSSSGSVRFLISGIPSWLNASFTSGTATTQPLTVTITLSGNARTLAPGSYDGQIVFINAMNGQGTQTRNATLVVAPDKQRSGDANYASKRSARALRLK